MLAAHPNSEGRAIALGQKIGQNIWPRRGDLGINSELACLLGIERREVTPWRSFR